MVDTELLEKPDIESRILKLEDIDWRKLKFLQDDDFKQWIDKGDEKLLESIIRYQFIDPFKVWENEGTIYCLDGKHRFLDLDYLESVGHPVPQNLPAVFIDCKDKKSAAELVLVYSSAYSRITQEGLFNFVNKFEIDISDMTDRIAIPDFSIDRFEQKYDIFQSQEDEEPIPEDPDVTIVKSGDIFELNGHRLVCGSFTDRDTVTALMQGKKARIVNCDPPYNLPTNFFSGIHKKDFAMGGGEMTDQEFVEFLALIMERSKENTLNGAIHYIFMDFRHAWHMTEAARRVYGSPQPKQVCVWNKDIFANGSFYRAQHELCFIFHDDRAKYAWNKDMLDRGGEFYKDNNEWCYIFKSGEAKHLSHLELKDRIRSNVWKYPSGASRANPDHDMLKNHPTPKSLNMIMDSILDTTYKGDMVIDWFSGSGTTLLACEKTERLARVTEIEPMYVQLAITRYINHCKKVGKSVNFIHENGILTENDFTNGGKT